MSRQASSSSNGSSSSTSTSPPIPVIASAPPALASGGKLAAALTGALPSFLRHLADLEIQLAVDTLLALKGAAGGGGREHLDVMDNLLSPFLLLAAAEKMCVSPMRWMACGKD